MAEKTFLEKFNKYQPTDTEIIRVLSCVKEYTIRLDKEARIIEADVYFDGIVSKNLLYRMEDEIRAVYSLNRMKLLPKYPCELFDKQYFAQILIEAERIGIVARGFFAACDWEFKGEDITVTIPFVAGGVKLLENANTPKIIENIIFSEFGLKYNVKIVSDEKMSSSVQDKVRSELVRHDKSIAEQSSRYESSAQPSNTNNTKNEKEAAGANLPRVTTLTQGAEIQMNEGICEIGYKKFDISSPEYLYG